MIKREKLWKHFEKNYIFETDDDYMLFLSSNLTHVSLIDYFTVSSSLIDKISTLSPNITHLRLFYLDSKVTIDSYRQLFSISQLQFVSIRSCENIQNISIDTLISHNKSLKELSLIELKAIDDSAFQNWNLDILT